MKSTSGLITPWVPAVVRLLLDRNPPQTLLTCLLFTSVLPRVCPGLVVSWGGAGLLWTWAGCPQCLSSALWVECQASSQGRCPRDGSCQASSEFSLRGHRAPRHCIQEVGVSLWEERGGRVGVALGDWPPQPENQRQTLPYFTVLLKVITVCSFYCYSHKTGSSISL